MGQRGYKIDDKGIRRRQFPFFRLGLILLNRGSRKASKVIIGDGKFGANEEGLEREGMNANGDVGIRKMRGTNNKWKKSVDITQDVFQSSPFLYVLPFFFFSCNGKRTHFVVFIRLHICQRN